MCGILGAVNLNQPFSEEEKALLSENLEKISYRGPDAASERHFNSLNNANDQSNIYLGHRRLSIIDLSADGTQPFSNDEEVFLIFNGEIYNYIELRAALKAKGQVFKTETDTEVIVNLYKEEGVQGFGKMNGMWSFMLYDKVKKQIILSRDRFSIKPLYIYEHDGLFIFSSEIKQILPFVDDLKPNKNVLGNYLTNYIIDYSEETFFEGINKLPAKSAMTIDLTKKTRQIEKYWDYQLEDFSDRKETDLVEEFQDLFQNAVKIRLRSDVKVGNTLSGGLDSSSIAVTADKVGRTKLTNLSMVSNDKKISEEHFLDILQEKNGIHIQKIRNDNLNPWTTVEKVIWHNDEPILSLSTVAHFNMMKAFKEKTDITVIMSGQGGDETLAGYNKYFFYNLLQAKNDKRLGRLVKEGFHMLPKFFGEFRLDMAKRYIGSNNKQEGIIDKVCNFEFKNEFNQTKFTNFRDRQTIDIDKFSVPALTHYEDRSSMHKSLEIRLPFLDYRLVNFNINLPIELKINNGYSKYMIRKAVKELPEEIAWRKDKKGFDTEENLFDNLETVKYVEQLFQNSILEKYGLIKADVFLKEFKSYLNGKVKYWVRHINRIIFAEIWAKTYLK